MSLLYLSTMMTVFLSILFTQITHPLAMGVSLLIQTILIAGMTSFLSKTTWFSYILFLIFLGAMLVLFIYVASLAPNESFSIPPLLTSVTLMGMTMSFVVILVDPLLSLHQLVMEMSFISPNQISNSPPVVLSTIYNLSAMSMTIFIILYLLLTLIVVVKITYTHFGPLRLN
uniref:NADH-ubiquinone oxidoreductase chain 6 n=1 Tax=Paratya australiensis TaxID=159741 RepID=A0A0U2DYW4_PARAS|nr:NADH dehydrogenase subunit 6 [Paratya australiensis]AKQ09519.1 NADH dehydrogenase subunit 6 [Paratya australiensis]